MKRQKVRKIMTNNISIFLRGALTMKAKLNKAENDYEKGHLLFIGDGIIYLLNIKFSCIFE